MVPAKVSDLCAIFELINDFLFRKPTSDVLPAAFNTHSNLPQALPLSDVLLSENPPLSQLNVIKASNQAQRLFTEYICCAAT